MASFVILLTARTARIACSDRHTYIHTYIHTDRQTDRQTHRTTTVTLAAHARRGLTTNCSFNATSSTMYTVVVNATNDVGSNSSMMTFYCKLLNPDWVCTVYALNVQHCMNAEPIYRNNNYIVYMEILPLTICMSCTTCVVHGKSSSTICSIRGTACTIIVTFILTTHNYGHRHCCN